MHRDFEKLFTESIYTNLKRNLRNIRDKKQKKKQETTK